MILEECVNKLDGRLDELVCWKDDDESPMILKITITLPFMRTIMEEPLPKNLKTPSTKGFHGATNSQ